MNKSFIMTFTFRINSIISRANSLIKGVLWGNPFQVIFQVCRVLLNGLTKISLVEENPEYL